MALLHQLLAATTLGLALVASNPLNATLDGYHNGANRVSLSVTSGYNNGTNSVGQVNHVRNFNHYQKHERGSRRNPQTHNLTPAIVLNVTNGPHSSRDHRLSRTGKDLKRDPLNLDMMPGSHNTTVLSPGSYNSGGIMDHVWLTQRHHIKQGRGPKKDSLGRLIRKDWCRTVEMQQTVIEKGCFPAYVANQLCYGQCNSFFIPRRGRSFKSCPSCVPHKIRKMSVRLVCPSALPKTVRIVKVLSCKCKVSFRQ